MENGNYSIKHFAISEHSLSLQQVNDELETYLLREELC